MNIYTVKETRVRDDKKPMDKDRFSDARSSFPEDFAMGFDDLLADAMGNSPMQLHNFTTLPNSDAFDDGVQLFSGQGAGTLSFNSSISSEDNESFSPRYTSDALVKQLMNNPAANNMSFSIEQGFDKLNVEALISNGCLRCDIKPSNESLGRKLRRSRQEIEKDIGKRMRLSVAISIDSQLDQ